MPDYAELVVTWGNQSRVRIHLEDEDGQVRGIAQVLARAAGTCLADEEESCA